MLRTDDDGDDDDADRDWTREREDRERRLLRRLLLPMKTTMTVESVENETLTALLLTSAYCLPCHSRAAAVAEAAADVL
jgi:hypothetical protein